MDADTKRDALAFLAAALRDDCEGIAAVVDNCDLNRLVATLAATVIEVLRDHGTDPAEWVAAQQGLVREELGDPGA